MAGAAKPRSRAVDGIVLLNKPVGMTSNAALQRVKRGLRAKKAGHTGSLDPAATGMLPLCFGEATKVAPFLLDADKTYRVAARLGVATDTGDADGSCTTTAPVREMTAADWQAVLDSFLGDSEQVPPMYSALKHKGRRLYELARRGEQVERAPRPVTIRSIVLLEATASRLVFRVSCTKGTYIRTLVEDVAARAGTVAHTRRLHRESVAGFPGERMQSLSRVERAIRDDAPEAVLLPPDRALMHFPEVVLSAAAAGDFRQGRTAATDMAAARDGEWLRVYAADRAFMGLGTLDDRGQVAPKRVFNLPPAAGPNGLNREAGEQP